MLVLCTALLHTRLRVLFTHRAAFSIYADLITSAQEFWAFDCLTSDRTIMAQACLTFVWIPAVAVRVVGVLVHAVSGWSHIWALWATFAFLRNWVLTL